MLISVNSKSLAHDYEEVFLTALEILSSAVDHWRQQKNLLWVFIQAEADLGLRSCKDRGEQLPVFVSISA